MPCARRLLFFADLVLKKGYSLHEVALVAAISAVIMLLRAIRTPMAVLLQAAGEFRALAWLAISSGIVSLIATLSLLLAFGPIASMAGLVLGELGGDRALRRPGRPLEARQDRRPGYGSARPCMKKMAHA